ncbi:multidrug ABC transporter permease [Rhizocola hellebori]|uniref:Multidrug ABC transporter permease n=1 Tax=Rhizocola hellebori TaxID=1392758 RepID=A0A8J3VDV3_9ACTN|nr:ABC transporter ATP-binding protein/permease [Rhizocola hellebori]GIH02772.1 multidrug ABC transporter permease [Rhizocola hellebori]
MTAVRRRPRAIGLSPRHAWRHARVAARLAFAAAPVTTGVLLGLSVLEGMLPVATAWLTKLVLDGIAGSAAAGSPAVGWLAAGLAATGACVASLGHLTRYLDAELSRAVALTSQERLYEAINRLNGLARLENPQFHDRLQLAVHAGREAPAQLIHGVRGTVQSGIMTLGFVGTLMVINPWMLAVVAAAAVPTLVTELALSRRRAATATALGPTGRREMFFAGLLTRLDAAKESRLHALGEFFRIRMFRELRTANAAHRATDRRTFFAQGSLALLGATVTGAGVVWAVHAAAAGRLTVGDISAFAAAVAGVQIGLGAVAARAAIAHHALLLFGQFDEITTAEPDLPVPAQPKAVPALRRGIELRDVWFRYSPDHPWVLRGVNLFIQCGQSVGLVGINGAGKSTIVKLLCRFYDPSRGAVLWDGVDLRDLSIAQLRDRIGAVFQDFMEYELSALENIGVGDLSALTDPARIVDAARRADVHDTITALPRQYDTMLSRIFAGPRDEEDTAAGVLLSGGQWQRVALARAFLRRGRDLLILDEPSSGLDAAAEALIHQRLREQRRGTTSVLISHRLSAVRDADQIAVLDDGVVAELGCHADLMAADGPYAHLFTLQAAGYQPGDRAVTGVA